jgi:hypothetical protein
MKRRSAIIAALGAVALACGTKPAAQHAAPPPRPATAWTGCTDERTLRHLEVWATAAENDLAPYPAPGSAVAVHDVYCTLEENRVLDEPCLSLADCDQVPGHEVLTASCSGEPNGRWARLDGIALSDAQKSARNVEGDAWRTRLGQCYAATWAPAPASEVAAIEAALRQIDVEHFGEGAGIVQAKVRPPDANYHRVFVTIAREVTQLRGTGPAQKGIVRAESFLFASRGGTAASPPFPHFTVAMHTGFLSRETTPARAAAGNAYCGELVRGNVGASYDGDDPTMQPIVVRNQRIAEMLAGKVDARDVQLPVLDDGNGDLRFQLAKPIHSLRDPCGR